MKRQTLGVIITIIGMFLAICTADGSNHELLLRAIGVGLSAIGAYMAEWFDFQNE